MKKYSKMLCAVFVLLAMSRCGLKEEVSSSYRASTEELENTVVEMVGAKAAPQVVDVKYIEEGTQCINLVTYKMAGKSYTNVALVKGVGAVLVGGKSIQLNAQAPIKIKCKGTCTNTTGGCTIVGEYDPETGTNTLECSCEGCVMETN